MDWAEDAALTDQKVWVQRPGNRQEPGASSLGWDRAIELSGAGEDVQRLTDHKQARRAIHWVNVDPPRFWISYLILFLTPRLFDGFGVYSRDVEVFAGGSPIVVGCPYAHANPNAVRCEYHVVQISLVSCVDLQWLAGECWREACQQFS